VKHLLSAILLCAFAHGGATPAATGTLPDAPSHFLYRPFWTPENTLGFGILGSLFVGDAITTQIGLDNGYREANPLMRPFTSRGPVGVAAGSALGFGTGIGIAYLLHRSHHYKAERISLRLMVAGEGAVVGHNIATIR
jgi:hypothetical protein